MKKLAKKLFLIGAFASGIIIYTSEKSFASGGTKIIEKLNCENSDCKVVSYGAGCQNGDSGCIANACPQGSSQQ